MKLLYIANVRLPTEKAHGIQIMKMCEALAGQGVEVELVVPARKTSIHEDPFTYYGVARVFTITYVHSFDTVGLGWIGFWIQTLSFVFASTKYSTQSRADIVYARGYESFWFMRAFAGKKLLWEVHAKPSRRTIQNMMRLRVYAVAITKRLRDVLLLEGMDSSRVIVAPDAVDEHFFDTIASREVVRAELGFSVETKIVVYTGHLYGRKGAGTLAQAAEHLPDMQFVFVGGTHYDIKHFRTRWESQKNIHIVGHVPPPQVPQYLRAADVLVIPNSAKDQDSSQFTSPMKLFEYMASGTPIVASDVPAIREILTKDEASFFTPDNADSVAKSIVESLSNEHESSARAQSAQKKAKEYSWKKRAKSILGMILTC